MMFLYLVVCCGIFGDGSSLDDDKDSDDSGVVMVFDLLNFGVKYLLKIDQEEIFLYFVVCYLRVDMIKCLLDFGVDVNLCDWFN